MAFDIYDKAGVDAPLTAAVKPTVDAVQTGRLSEASLSATFATHIGAAARRAGRSWLFVGTSILNGSNASNISYSYSRQACDMAGTWRVARVDDGSYSAAYPGSRLGENLGRLPELLDTYDTNAVFLEVGPNDSSDTAPTTALVDYMADARAAVALIQARGRGMRHHDTLARRRVLLDSREEAHRPAVHLHPHVGAKRRRRGRRLQPCPHRPHDRTARLNVRLGRRHPPKHPRPREDRPGRGGRDAPHHRRRHPYPVDRGWRVSRVKPRKIDFSI